MNQFTFKHYHSESEYFENETDDAADDTDADYEFAMAITANLLAIEIIHRVLVVFYEVWFTMQGGATPGKKTMKIKIISCNKSVLIGKMLLIICIL